MRLRVNALHVRLAKPDTLLIDSINRLAPPISLPRARFCDARSNSLVDTAKCTSDVYHVRERIVNIFAEREVTAETISFSKYKSFQLNFVIRIFVTLVTSPICRICWLYLCIYITCLFFDTTRLLLK